MAPRIAKVASDYDEFIFDGIRNGFTVGEIARALQLPQSAVHDRLAEVPPRMPKSRLPAFLAPKQYLDIDVARLNSDPAYRSWYDSKRGARLTLNAEGDR